MPKLAQVGRLAMREEGEFWNAYYALPDTMDGAMLLGALHLSIAGRREAKDAFMALMRDAVGDIIEHATGARPVWPQPLGQRAPEHERAGHA